MKVFYEPDFKMPPHGGSVWLTDDELHFTFPSMSMTLRGKHYDCSGGTIVFSASESGEKDLLHVLREQAASFADEASLIRYAETMSK